MSYKERTQGASLCRNITAFTTHTRRTDTLISHLNDFRVHGWLEMRVNAWGKERAAPFAPAVVPEEAVRDGAGPPV